MDDEMAVGGELSETELSLRLLQEIDLPDNAPIADPKDEYSTTESIPNGSSIAVNLLDQNDVELKPHVDYLIPVKVTHPLEENVAWTFARTVGFHFVGFLIGLPIVILLLCALVIMAPIRFLIHILSRYTPHLLFSNIIPFTKTHCDPWWPLSSCLKSASLMQSVVTLQSSLSLPEVRQQISERIVQRVQDRSGRRKFNRFSQVPSTKSIWCRWIGGRWKPDANFHIMNHISEFNKCNINTATCTKRSSNSEDCSVSTPCQRAIRLSSVKDLELYMNSCYSNTIFKRSPWMIKLVSEFGNAQEGTACSLALLELNSQLTDSLCVPRFLSIWTDGRMTFDVEPKFRRAVAVSGSNMPPYNVFLSMSYAFWTCSRIVTAGPLTLLVSAFKEKHPLWKQVTTNGTTTGGQGSKKLRIGPAVKKYRVSTTASVSAEGRTSSLCSSALISNNELSLTRRVSWTRIPNMDQILRTERILRCATFELLLAFVSGALRRHFRTQGIRHPPNLNACVPVSNRDYLPIGRHAPCDFVLLPIELAVGIEGNIPRLWHVQRKLADSLDDSFSLATKIAAFIGNMALPGDMCGRLLRQTHKSSGCVITFLRASGDVNLCSRKIHSILLHSPIPIGVEASFNFVQCGTEMLVSLTVDTRAFPEPDKLINHLQADILSLLRQLSVRLLTLSQATFLPSYQVLPQYSGRQIQQTQTHNASRALRLDDMAAVASTKDHTWTELHATISDDSEIIASQDEDGQEASLEELEKLLATVHDELEMMKANPQGDRMEYVAKLAELERKMDAFHRSISQRIGAAAIVAASDSVDFGAESSAVEALLGPYRDESVVTPEHRRYSRDVRRDSVVTRLLRRRSRRLDSPTRRLSTVSSPNKSFESQFP